MNSLQKPCNYYDKYMKYKTKYIEYKNKLLVVNGKKRGGSSEGRSMLVGGGKNAGIEFYSDKELTKRLSSITNITDITDKKPLYIKIMVSYEPQRIYEVVKQVGKGTIGTVFTIKQIIPQQSEPQQQPPSQMFVIKLSILKSVGDNAFNKEEGENIRSLYVPDRVQALFQGKTDNIDFAIFNYLGQDLKTFLRDNSSTMNAMTILSLIKRLNNQLHGLNSNNYFHNDIKMQNIVVQKVIKINETTGTEYFEYVPSIIDYGLVTQNESQMGTTESMCIYGCANFLLYEIEKRKKKEEKEKGREEEEKRKEEEEKRKEEQELILQLRLLLKKATSTDYVGFFNIIICLLSFSESAYQIYLSILELKGGYSPNYLLKILCLLCYVSNSAECDDFLAMPQCVEIVQKIDTKLKDSNTYMALFTPFISDSGREITQHMQRRLLFLCFIYSAIISGTGNVKFVHISKLPKFLLDISCCLDLRFDLEQFNVNFGIIFNEKLLEPAPAPTQPASEPAP
jgi:hypothetical protein